MAWLGHGGLRQCFPSAPTTSPDIGPYTAYNRLEMSTVTHRRGQTNPGNKQQSNLRSFLTTKDIDKMAPEPKQQRSTSKAQPSQQHVKVGAIDIEQRAHLPPPPLSPQNITYLFDEKSVDVGDLFQSLPTKEDMKAMIANLEKTQGREFQEVRGEIVQLSTRVEVTEAGAAIADTRMDRLERMQASYESQLSELRLQIEDQEDRNRRNNLRIKVIPESEGVENFIDLTTSLFQLVLGPTDPDIFRVLLDLVH